MQKGPQRQMFAYHQVFYGIGRQDHFTVVRNLNIPLNFIFTLPGERKPFHFL